MLFIVEAEDNSLSDDEVPSNDIMDEVSNSILSTNVRNFAVLVYIFLLIIKYRKEMN